jgi:hypothetical protein
LQGDVSIAAYAPAASGPGHMLFVRSGTLMAQPFDPGKLLLSEGPLSVAAKVGYSSITSPPSFSVSDNGVLVYN